MDLLINLLIGLSMAAVLASLGLGLFAMAKGGDYNARNGNKFMRWRVWTQAAAVGVLTISLLYKASH
jgi:hypothetical protein